MTKILAFLGYFPFFAKGNYETAFTATEINVHIPKLSFNAIYNFLSLIEEKLEFETLDLQMGLWPWAEGQGQIFLV